ncbi:site-specific integrase [Enterobacter kobei]|uniref:site-specific integrase n=1 Tax=Enterobacter kobei TaxID=208224 RepID=UPI00092D2863|nr:site-specific integrase [Enterobacter kobei]
MNTEQSTLCNHGDPAGYASVLIEYRATFREYLACRGYSNSYIQRCGEVMARFSRWVSEMCLHLSDVNEALVEVFLYQRVPDYVDPVSGYRRNHSRSPLVHLLIMLRATELIPPQTLDMTPVAVELRRFDDYLLQARGLALRTRESYVRIIGRFLREKFGDGDIKLLNITPKEVRDYLTSQASIYKIPATFGMIVSNLRGYFRWRITQDDDLHALVAVLTNPVHWRLSSLPKSLSIKDIEQLLNSLGQANNPIGLRADAMVRCALDLGLRVSEITHLSLDDIDWEAGTITLRRTKGHRDDVMPLPATTGNAIAAYLKGGRPKTLHRLIFASHKMPHECPICRSVVGTAIRQVYARAGLQYTSAHLLRHTMANRLLATGSSIKEIADILRHRSLNATRIYAKLDSRKLACVALPWPGSSGTTGRQA